MLRSICLTSLLLCLVTVAHAEGLEQPLTIESLRIGFGNTYKLGCWTPVEVQLGAPLEQGTEVVFQAPDGDSVPVRFIDRSDQDGDSILTYAKIGRGDQSVEIRLPQAAARGRRSSATLQKKLLVGDLPRALPATNEFVVELGGSVGFADLASRIQRDDSGPAQFGVATITTPQRLPDQWYGYEGVDVVVVAGTPNVSKFFADRACIAALDEWIRFGGTLLIACAERAETLLGPGKALARFAPGEFAGMGPLSPVSFGQIESYASLEGKEERLPAVALNAPLWKNVSGKSDASFTEIPLVIRTQHGFGQVIFVGLDLHAANFTEWPNQHRFLQRLLTGRSPRASQPASFDASRGMQFGYVDLSGQLRGALDQFDDVALIPFWAVAMLAVLYIACLSPLNFWLASRQLKRPRIAWIMFVLVAVVFSAGAYRLATQSKGNEVRVNQIDLVDIDVTTNAARGTTWFNVYSPDNTTFDLQVEPGFAGIREGGNKNRKSDTPVLLSWLGLSGGGLGGMNSKAAGAPLFDEPYEINVGQGSVGGAPIAIWSSKAFVARWQAAAGGIESDLTSAGRLRGTITNKLNIPLTDCVLMYDKFAWQLGEIAADEVKRLDLQTPIQVDSFLTKRELYSTRSHTPPYDRAGFDVPRILEVMMFHDAAGGANYSGLLHRQHRFTDLSSQLEFGKAILIGRAKSGAVLKIDGETVESNVMNDHHVMYRYVLPVSKQ
jgi:hypothetical protein